MCVAYRVQLATVDPDGTAGTANGRTIVLLALTDPVAPGDWVLVHAGIALARITEEEACLTEAKD